MKNKSKRRRTPKKSTPIIPSWLLVVAGIILVGTGGFLLLQPSSSAPATTPIAGNVSPTSPATPTVTPTKISTTKESTAQTQTQLSTPTPVPTKTAVPLQTSVAKEVSSSSSSPQVTPTITARVSTTLFYTYTIVNTYDHDRNAFTQGLVYQDDIFYEGTGLYGRSSLRKVEPETGRVLQIIDLPADVFGEGITIFGDKLYQLTWKAGRAFVYNKDSFELLNEFTYPTEGWGLTHDGKKLIMSDGTAYLYFRNPETFEEINRIEVVDDSGPVVRLNELEYINGEVYANIWKTNRIARINPETGRVTGWIILPNMLTPEDFTEPVDVLNGIAYDTETDRLFITGKLWPKLFEIELTPLQLPVNQIQ